MYEDVKNEVKQSLFEADRVAITTDGWTSCSTEGPLATNSLREKQRLLALPQHKLKTDVCTRWNSSCEMLECFLEQKAAVEATLMSKDFRKGEEANTLKDCDISSAEDVVQLMTPIKMATTVMCEEQQPTVSVIAPLKAKLLSHLKPNEDDSAIVKEMKNVMVKDLSDRYSDVNDSLYKASALDPRFKELPFIEFEERECTYAKVAVEAADIHTKMSRVPKKQRHWTCFLETHLFRCRRAGPLLIGPGKRLSDTEQRLHSH
ncbi:hypothetical protein SKAU_G00311720 [Synaphobranchus kaupii]|uniref:Uncharacterized protein n=1 Tax=Synaphobranchus kaupii TaxID=118154 RepID=A0A9Q1IL43_SYNKA|nr:hypothetical protein SKAU_G00311720 [Synaphobranchus kaupii]